MVSEKISHGRRGSETSNPRAKPGQTRRSSWKESSGRLILKIDSRRREIRSFRGSWVRIPSPPHSLWVRSLKSAPAKLGCNLGNSELQKIPDETIRRAPFGRQCTQVVLQRVEG